MPDQVFHALLTSDRRSVLSSAFAPCAMLPLHFLGCLLMLVFRQTIAQMEFCDKDCQQAQRESLQLLYAQTSGSKWQHSDGWTSLPCGSACDSWPQHCSWSGVHCCLPVGVLMSGAPHFPSSAAVNCTRVGGVVALLLGNQHMQGSLTEEVWPALAGSLKYLDLSGDKANKTLHAYHQCLR